MQLDRLMIHTVTRAPHAPNTVPGDSGAPAFGAQATFKARIEKKAKLVRTRDGSEVVAGHQLVTTTVLSTMDRFWFPSIGGEPADNTARPDDARTPVAVDVTPSVDGRTNLFTAYFA